MLIDLFYTGTWLCEPNYLRVIEKVLKEHAEGKRNSLEDIAALEAKLGKPLDNSINNLYTRNNGETAIIPIHGSIVRHGGLISRASGLTSTEELSLSFNEAINDERIKSIVFDIASPGGEATGINEFAHMIYNARGIKPIKAYVSGNAQSAAYWIATACDEIVCDDTAGLGSIGVAVFIDDDSEAKAREGVRELVIKNKLSPNKLPDFTTEEGREQIQERLDQMANVFFSKVALYRSSEGSKLTAKDVVKNFKQGGTATGEEAVSLGMADRLGSLEGLLKELKETEMKNSEEVAPNAEATDNTPKTNEIDLTKFVSVEKFQELSDQLSALAESTRIAEEAKAAAEAQAEEARVKLEQAEEARKESELKLKAEESAKALGKKLAPTQKEGFAELYTFISKAGGDVKVLENLLNAQVALEVLSEEQLAEGDLRELPNNEEESDEDWDEIDRQTKEYAAKVNSRGK